MQTFRLAAPHAKLPQYAMRLRQLDGAGRMDSLFSPQAVLPEQFHGASRRAAKNCSEAALMYAVLEDAVECFCRQFVSQSRRDQRLAREAKEWFFSESDHWPFSFVNICTMLELNPEYIRAGLKRLRPQTSTQRTWKTRRRARISPPLWLAS